MIIVPNDRCPYNARLLAIQADGWEVVGAGGHGGGGAHYTFRKGTQLRFIVASRTRIMDDIIRTGH